MSQYFGWTPSVAGLVQSAFFYGCVLMQLPGGYATQKQGGRQVLPAGVAVWSAATFCMPLLASTIPSLCITRYIAMSFERTSAIIFQGRKAARAFNDSMGMGVGVGVRACVFSNQGVAGPWSVLGSWTIRGNSASGKNKSATSV